MERVNSMLIRKAMQKDLQAIAAVYDEIHTQEEAGKMTTGWHREVYPTLATAERALERDDLFVMEDGGDVIGAAIINQQQVDVYAVASWENEADASEVMVLHTLVISPARAGKGYGKQFVRFYEEYALVHGCRYLRMDTNERNSTARALYCKLGYREAGIVPCVFNGLKDVQLVLLEKKL